MSIMDATTVATYGGTVGAIIHDTSGELTRYDLNGQRVATAVHTDVGWIITDDDGCTSPPIESQVDARQALAEWDHAEAARVSLGLAVEEMQRAREALEAAIRRADDAGVPKTQIARITGFSRQWIPKLLQRQ